MKRITSLLVISLAILVISGCKKEGSESGEVNNLSTTYKAIAFNVTGTWCHVCGTSGVQAFDKLFEDYPYQVVGIGVHTGSDPTVVPEAMDAISAFKDAFGVTGVPAFAVNNKKSSGSYNSVNSDVKAALDANSVAKAGVGIAKEENGGTITVKYKVKAFADCPNGIKLAIYALKHNVLTGQKYDLPGGGVGTQDWTHNYIFKGTADGQFSDIWGMTLSQKATAGDEYEGEATFTVPGGEDAAELTFAAVLWSTNMDGETPAEMINSNIIERPEGEVE